MELLQVFLNRNAALHASLERRLLRDLSEAQARQSPQPGVNSLVWLIWHMARAEDFGVTRIVVNGRQVLDEDDWLERLNISRRDIATGMSDEEVSTFSASVNLSVLLAYWNAVGEQTRAVVVSLHPETLDEVIDAAYVNDALSEKGVLLENASWLKQVFANQTRGDVLVSLGLTHSLTHLGEALVTRTLLGQRGR